MTSRDPQPHLSDTESRTSSSGKSAPFARLKVLLMVLAIATVLVGIYRFCSAVEQARTAARRSSSKGYLKQLGLGFQIHVDNHGGLPPHTTTDVAGNPLYGWAVPLLPYIDGQEIYDQIDLSKSWDHPDQIDVFKTPHGMLCGSVHEPPFNAGGFPVAVYAANSRLLKINANVLLADIPDGEQHTILLGEIALRRPPWAVPGNVRDPAGGLKRNDFTFGGPFPDVTQFCFADGSVRAISDDIDHSVLKALATPAANDTVLSSTIR